MFRAVSFERYDVVCQVCATRENAFNGNASLKLGDPGIAHFLEHPTIGCPRSVIRGSNMPALLRNWQELDADRRVSCDRSTNNSEGEGSGEQGG